MKKVLFLLTSILILNSCTTIAPEDTIEIVDSTLVAVDTLALNSSLISTTTVVTDSVK